MHLNEADAGFAAHLGARLPDDTLGAAAPHYLEEPRGRYAGRGGILARPRNTKEVATIIRACAEARVGVVPYGGGTGLVGGQIAESGPAPLILAFFMNAAIDQQVEKHLRSTGQWAGAVKWLGAAWGGAGGASARQASRKRE